jgi:ERCC4-type nuclease
MELLIDYREKKIIEHFTNNVSSIKKLVKVENLDIGDIIIKINSNTILLIERKKMEDLGASIRDGRHKEQKYRIMNSNIPLKNVLFLIEGEIKDLKHGNIKKNTLLGAILNTMFRDGINVFRTKDVDETCFFLERFISKYLKDGNKNIKNLLNSKDTNNMLDENPNINYIDVKKVKKKNNLTPEVFNQLVLLQIPGVSNLFVERIFKEYNSIKHILKAYEEIDKLEEEIVNEKNKGKKKKISKETLKEIMLSELEIEITNGKKRKIGKVISKRIYEFLNI